jgi:hypothetical protein
MAATIPKKNQPLGTVAMHRFHWYWHEIEEPIGWHLIIVHS